MNKLFRNIKRQRDVGFGPFLVPFWSFFVSWIHLWKDSRLMNLECENKRLGVSYSLFFENKQIVLTNRRPHSQWHGHFFSVAHAGHFELLPDNLFPTEFWHQNSFSLFMMTVRITLEFKKVLLLSPKRYESIERIMHDAWIIKPQKYHWSFLTINVARATIAVKAL